MHIHLPVDPRNVQTDVHSNSVQQVESQVGSCCQKNTQQSQDFLSVRTIIEQTHNYGVHVHAMVLLYHLCVIRKNTLSTCMRIRVVVIPIVIKLCFYFNCNCICPSYIKVFVIIIVIGCPPLLILLFKLRMRHSDTI